MNDRPRHQNSQYWLIGIPVKKATLWWKLVYRNDYFKKQMVPEHLAQAGVYCPICRHGQQFSDNCSFCGCNFSCFVIMESKRYSGQRIEAAKVKPDALKKHIKPVQSHSHGSAGGLQRSHLIIIGLSLIIILMIAIGIVQYRNYLQRQYAQNFITALYGINSGMNLAGVVCDGRYKSWKEGVPATDAGPTIIEEQAKVDLKTVMAEVDGVMKKITVPSSENEKAYRALKRLYVIYGMANTNLLASPVGKPILMNACVGVKDEFAREIGILKSDLPVGLVEEFKKAGKKYDLSFMAMDRQR